MIGALEGKVILRKKDTLVLMVAGVGYEVYIPSTLLSLVKLESDIFLHIHTHVREDTLDLFGFEQISELTLFEQLLSVSGVGPKTALLVVDRGVEKVYQAVETSDVSFFKTIPRLGNKNGQKIIIELKAKLGTQAEFDLLNSDGETQEILEVLQSMGFSKGEIISALKKLPVNDLPLEAKIKELLKILGKSK